MALPALLPLPIGIAPATSSEVPGAFDVAINGVGYMVDYSADGYSSRSVTKLKPQFDQGAQVGASSLNPEGLWPLSITDWHLGAGQNFFDKSDSDPSRFRSSKNIDVWTEGEIAGLFDTEKYDSTNPNLMIEVAGSRAYYANSNSKSEMQFTDGTWSAGTTTTMTGEPTSDLKDMASDGYHVIFSYAGDGLYLTDTTTTVMSSWITGMTDKVAYVKGRVMVSEGASIYNVTTAYSDTAALPTPLFTHRNADFKWVGFAEGEGFIYAAGFSGTASEIYRIGIQPDGTALDAPVIAGSLPAGEIIHSIFGYLGFVLIGTGTGVRLAAESETSGNLTIGALIETGSPCRDFAARGRWVWFTWENYDEISSGLGRIDLQNLTDTQALVPAYASDLMYSSPGIVTTVVIHSGELVFGLVGKGFMREQRFGLYPASGSAGEIESGAITFNLVEPKIAVSLLVEATVPSATEIVVYLKADDGNYQIVDTITRSGETLIQTDIEGSRLELKLKFDSGGLALTPSVRFLRLEAHPKVKGTKKVVLPLVLRTEVEGRHGGPHHYDIGAELERLEGWWDNQDVLTLQEGSRTRDAVLEDFSWQPEIDTNGNESRQGLWHAVFKIINDRMN